MIKVIAKNFTHENKKSELIELLKELKYYAIKKKCIKYELFQDNENETIITIISEWEKINHLEDYGFTKRSKNQNKFGKKYPKNHFSNEDGGFCQITQGTRSH